MTQLTSFAAAIQKLINSKTQKLNIFSLQGQLALVTGCKRGIGRAMAVGLAEAGADIIGVSASLEARQ